MHHRLQLILRALIGAFVALTAQSLFAQEQEGIAFGQLRLLLTAGLTWGHDSNVTFANDEAADTEAVSSNFYVFSPGIRLELPSDRSMLAVTWQGEHGEFEDSSRDNYDNWSLGALWDYDPTSRTSMGLFADWREDRDRRGEGRSQGNLGLQELEPDEYELRSIGGHFDYGAVGSRGKLGFKLRRNELEYQNNRDRTRLLDREDDHIEGTFFLRIRPKTSLLLHASKSEISYQAAIPGQPFRSSSEWHLGLGVTWDASARTTGRIEYGILEKDFDDPSIGDFDGEYWRASVAWQPRTYSTFTLDASRETDESHGFGDFVLREDISIDWRHFWTTRFNTIVEYGIGTDEHRPGIRTDDYTYWGVEARWQLNQHFQIGVGYNDYERESNNGEFNYLRDVWTITLEGSL